MKIAYVKFRNENQSAIISQTIVEEIRSPSIVVEFTPTHVVLKLYDGNIVAYESKMVISVFTKTYEEADE